MGATSNVASSRGDPRWGPQLSCCALLLHPCVAGQRGGHLRGRTHLHGKLCTQGIAFLYTTAVAAHTFGYIYNRLSMSQIVTMAVVVGNRMRLSGETCCVQVSLSMSDWRAVVAKLSACASLSALRLSHPLPAQPSIDGPDVPPVDVEAALTPLRLRGVAVDVGALMHTLWRARSGTCRRVWMPLGRTCICAAVEPDRSVARCCEVMAEALKAGHSCALRV